MSLGAAAVRERGAAFVLSTIGYLLLVGRLSVDEIGLAIGCGALAALWSVALTGAADIRFRFAWRAVVVLAKAVAGVPSAAARVGGALLAAGMRRRLRGGLVEQSCSHGRERSAADATRRAALLLAVSLAPDRFALVHQGDRLRVHRLGAGGGDGGEPWPA